MLIHGNLADYNPAEGHSVFVLYNDSGSVYDDNHIMYLAFTGIQSNPSDEMCDKWATLVIQVDLNKISSITSFATYGRRNSHDNLTESRLKQKTYHIQDWVWQILFAIGCCFSSPTGELFVGGTLDKTKQGLLPIGDIHSISGDIVSVVEEYSGLPKNGNWVRLPMCATSQAFGGNLFVSASQLAGVSPETVQNVLASVATVVIDVGTKAMLAGARAVDFYIPPLGIMEVRENPYNTSEISIGFEPLLALQHSANTLYTDGVWRPQDVMENLSHLLNYNNVGHPSTTQRGRLYQQEKKTNRRPRLLHRYLMGSYREGVHFGGKEDS